VTAALLEARGICVDYHLPVAERTRGRRTFRSVSDVSLRLDPGGRLGIVGESGSGKSTLARVLAGLQRPTSGTVTVDAPARRRGRPVQMIFQDPGASLNPRMTVRRSIERPLQLARGLAREALGDATVEILRDVGLEPELLDRYPTQISGGQRQRVAIGRALAADPKVLVADEPTSALDVSVQAHVLGRLDRVIAEHGLGLVFVTHDLGVVRAVAERVMVMYLGEIVEEGATAAVIEQPTHPYTQALLAAVPSPSRPGDRRIPLRAAPASAADQIPGCRFHTRCPVAIERCAVDAPPPAVQPNGNVSRCWLAPGPPPPATSRHLPPASSPDEDANP